MKLERKNGSLTFTDEEGKLFDAVLNEIGNLKAGDKYVRFAGKVVYEVFKPEYISSSTYGNYKPNKEMVYSRDTRKNSNKYRVKRFGYDEKVKKEALVWLLI